MPNNLQVDMLSDGNLLLVDLLRKLFPNTSRKQLSKSADKHYIL